MQPRSWEAFEDWVHLVNVHFRHPQELCIQIKTAPFAAHGTITPSWCSLTLQPSNSRPAHNSADLDPFKFRWLIPISALQVRLGNTAGKLWGVRQGTHLCAFHSCGMKKQGMLMISARDMCTDDGMADICLLCGQGAETGRALVATPSLT